MDRAEFERLKPGEQERVFHQTPFRERVELLLHSHNPAQLTQSLSPEELYLVTREMDLEDRAEVLRYATLPQLFFLSDMDCWKKDRLEPKRFVAWLEVLLEADEQRLLAWLVEMDYETVVSGFLQVIRVLKPEWEYPSDELLGDQPFFTLDELYFISVKEENIETIRRAIEILFENHRGRYAAILEGVLGELEYEVEEEAFQKRGVRLAERGFADPETAHHVYRRLTQEELDRFPLKSQDRRNGLESSPEVKKLPPYPALWSPGRLFLDEALLLFRDASPEIREGLEEELAWLSNKVIAAGGIDFASEERVLEGIERARRFVSLGLEVLSGRDLARARQILTEKWLEIIFRCGATRALELQDEAGKIVGQYWKGAHKAFLGFLDEPYDGIFRGLFSFPPQYFDVEVRDAVDRLRDFKNLEEIEKTRAAIRQVHCIHQYLEETFPNLFHHLNLRVLRREREDSLFTHLATHFASYTLKGKSSIDNLSDKEIFRLLEKAFEGRGEERSLKTESKDQFLNQFFPKESQELLKPLWGLVFQRLEEELGSLDSGKPIDRRFISI